LNPHDFRRWNLNPVRLPVPPRPRTKYVFAFPPITFNTITPAKPARSLAPAPNGASRPAVVRRRPAHKAGEPLSYAGTVPKTIRKSLLPERASGAETTEGRGSAQPDQPSSSTTAMAEAGRARKMAP